MQELEHILLEHAGRYPLMKVQDAVKLIYQNEFGAAHMITDEAACRAALYAEYAATPRSDAAPLRESLGSGMVRVHLAALEEEELSSLAADFIAGAGRKHGSLTSFCEKLSLLKRLSSEGLLPFSLDDCEAFLASYEAAGFPSVSHSEAYRRAYHPAYRVVPLL